MGEIATVNGYSERARRLLYIGGFVALGLLVGGVFAVAGETVGAVALVALVVAGNVVTRRYDPITTDERDQHIHRTASARTLEVVTVAGGWLVTGALLFDVFGVYARPAWAMPLGWAVAALLLIYTVMRAYERYA